MARLIYAPTRPWATSTRRLRLPRDWPKIRAAILERDGYRCRLGLPVCTIQATEVDHIFRGENHAESNLQAVCRDCHQVKSSSEGAAAKPKRLRPVEKHPGLL